MTSLPFTRDQSFFQTEGNLVSDMDGDKVMMSVQTGKYYNMGTTGGRIWELVAFPSAFDQIVSALCSEYKIERVKCEEQVSSFLNLLLQEGLIQTGKC